MARSAWVIMVGDDEHQFAVAVALSEATARTEERRLIKTGAVMAMARDELLCSHNTWLSVVPLVEE